MTDAFQAKRWWIVGASEGLGRALAHELAAAGAEVILSARNAARLEELAASLPKARAVPCDVREAASVKAATEAAGAVDGLIYAAGLYEPMKATAWDMAAAEAMADVNFTGALRVLGAAVPGMIGRGGGRIVLIGSLAGGRGLPGAIGYGASKAALVSLAETMRIDLDPARLTVQIVNPGYIKTRLTAKNDFSMPFLMTPEEAARRTRAAIESGRFRTDFPRRFALFFRLTRLLPDWMYWRIWR